MGVRTGHREAVNFGASELVLRDLGKWSFLHGDIG